MEVKHDINLLCPECHKSEALYHELYLNEDGDVWTICTAPGCSYRYFDKEEAKSP